MPMLRTTTRCSTTDSATGSRPNSHSGGPTTPTGRFRPSGDRSSFGPEQGVDLGDLGCSQRTESQSAGLLLGLGNRPDARQCDRSARPAPYISEGALDEGSAIASEDVADQVDPLQ